MSQVLQIIPKFWFVVVAVVASEQVQPVATDRWFFVGWLFFFWGFYLVLPASFFFLEDDARAARWLMRGADDGRRAAFGPLSLDDSAAGHRTVTDRCLFSSTQSKRPIAGRLSEHLSGPHRYGRFSLSLSLSLFLSIFLSFVFFVCVPARARVCVCGVGKDDSRRWVLLSSMGFHQKFSRFLGVYLVRIP